MNTHELSPAHTDAQRSDHPRTRLVIAPHAADEVLGCGGLLAKYPEECVVAVCSIPSQTRKQEAAAALAWRTDLCLRPLERGPGDPAYTPFRDGPRVAALFASGSTTYRLSARANVTKLIPGFAPSVGPLLAF